MLELITAKEYLTTDRVLLLHAYFHTLMDSVGSRQKEVSMLTHAQSTWRKHNSGVFGAHLSASSVHTHPYNIFAIDYFCF